MSVEGDGKARPLTGTRPSRARARHGDGRGPRREPASAARAFASVDGFTVTHPDKLWWPRHGIRKVDALRYYARMEPLLRPWLRDRLLVAERCPEGLRSACFFQKDFPDGLPRGVPTRTVRARSTGEDVHFVVGGAKRTLLALANLGSIAMHVMNCRRDALDRPDWLAFDLDPRSRDFADAARAGRLIFRILEEVGVRSYPKTSGGRGLHILVPLRRAASQHEVRAAATAIAREAAARDPDLIATEARKAKRRGRVYVDVMRNAFSQTIPAPYSVRHRPHATVSAPLEWDEVTTRLDPTRFTVRTIEDRIERATAWADFWRRRQSLPSLHGTPAPRASRGAR